MKALNIIISRVPRPSSYPGHKTILPSESHSYHGPRAFKGTEHERTVLYGRNNEARNSIVAPVDVLAGNLGGVIAGNNN